MAHSPQKVLLSIGCHSLKNSGTRSNLLSGGAPWNCSQNDGAPSGKQAIISRGSCGVQGVPACGPLGIRERRYIDKPTRRARPRSAAILDVAAIVVRLFGGSVCLMEPAWRDLLYNLQTVPIKPKAKRAKSALEWVGIPGRQWVLFGGLKIGYTQPPIWGNTQQ